jgi:transposase
MSTAVQKPATTPVPVQLSETEFTAFIFPHLSMPKRGPQCKLGYHCVFNLILWVLYTGMQWKCLPMPKDTNGNPAIHYTTVYKVFAKWADDGSLWQAFMDSVAHLAAEKHLDLSVLHGDGTNTVAKKGGMALATRATSTRKGRRSSPSLTPMAMCWLSFPRHRSMRRIWSCCRKGCKP